MAITIRHAEPDDHRPIVAVVDAWWGGRRMQAYIHFVGVDPARRGSGVGRALYERFFAAARALGCTHVYGVTSPVNHASVAFHTAMGFEVLPGDAESAGTPYSIDYDGPGESRVQLRKRI